VISCAADLVHSGRGPAEGTGSYPLQPGVASRFRNPAFSAARDPATRSDTGLIRAVVTKGGFIIGVGGGTGTLVFRGKHYPLQISGMSFGATIGASTTDLRGHAYHMHSPGDIEGTYSTIGAGAAIAGGAGGVRLQNAKGMILELTGVKVGAELSAAVGGVEVRFR
jgi:hypothetical protein